MFRHTCGTMCSIGLAGLALWATPGVRAQDPIAELRALYPGVRVHDAGHHHTYFYGTPMTPGQTEALAAADFLNQHGAVFGGPLVEGRPETSTVWTTQTRDDRFIVYAYRQRIRGKDVDGSDIRIKVRRGAVPRVDYAAARLAGEPTVGSEMPLLPSAIAVLLVQAQSGIPGLTVEGSPEVVALRGTATRPDAWCWRVRTREGSIPNRRTHYVDTASPRILAVREHFAGSNPPTTGTVEGVGLTSGPPWLPYGAPLATLTTYRIPGISVQGTYTPPPYLPKETVLADGDGEFVLSSGSSGQGILVDATFERQAEWYRIDTSNALHPYPFYYPVPDYLSASQQATVGAFVPLLLSGNNPNNFVEEMRVAQVTAVIAARRCRDFLHQYISPGFPLSLILRPNTTDSSGACGKWFGFGSIHTLTFTPSHPEGYRNCASHSMVGHEFGHAVMNIVAPEVGSGFGEGFADAFDHMVRDDCVTGPEQESDGGNTRDDPRIINCWYPLGSPNEPCGCAPDYTNAPLLSGVWVRIREGFKADYPADGLEYSRMLFGAWCLVMMGGDADCEGAYPGTLIEVLNSLWVDDANFVAIITDSFAGQCAIRS